MSLVRIIALTSLTMLAFAGNSLLCRVALAATAIDAASFTTVRLVAGAVTLWLIGWCLHSEQSARKQPNRSKQSRDGTWGSALFLFAYAVGFSFAYIKLSAGTGALLLFGAVQVTMIGGGLLAGERLNWRQLLGFISAFAGLSILVTPGLEAPSFLGSALMLGAGVAWGIYSMRGQNAGNPILKTGGNFLRAVPFSLVVSLLFFRQMSLDGVGIGLAAASGGLTSGVGYAIWYQVLPALPTTSAAAVQLCVPVLATFGGVVLLSEPITLRLVVASLAVLGGLALFILSRNRSRGSNASATS